MIKFQKHRDYPLGFDSLRITLDVRDSVLVFCFDERDSLSRANIFKSDGTQIKSTYVDISVESAVHILRLNNVDHLAQVRLYNHSEIEERVRSFLVSALFSDGRNL